MCAPGNCPCPAPPLPLPLPWPHLPQVDGLGAAVVIAATAGGAVLGGYNPEGWIGLGEDRASNGAFLFTWPAGDTARGPVFKLAKVRGARARAGRGSKCERKARDGMGWGMGGWAVEAVAEAVVWRQ